ncbi:hypothetical protein H6P81_017752 [Aristolochia fimbriata]|uniref:Uncharacterized protein n=1 Tax=Aristolochia fimbriata TaxID=158543 RepID=A0AAV7DZT2_ARIFI|nr:hypothetical protein H6P81_017752 [Aristolochia fimbriata]
MSRSRAGRHKVSRTTQQFEAEKDDNHHARVHARTADNLVWSSHARRRRYLKQKPMSLEVVAEGAKSTPTSQLEVIIGQRRYRTVNEGHDGIRNGSRTEESDEGRRNVDG